MKIFFLLNHFLPNSKGGTENYVYNLSLQLTQEGNNIKVVIPNYISFEIEKYFYKGIEIVKVPSPIKGIINFHHNSSKYFEDLLHEEKPDIIHVHEIAGKTGINIEHIKIAKKLSIQVIMTMHVVSYVCKTQTLRYLDKNICDGFIDDDKCTKCFLNHKGLGKYRHLLHLMSKYSFFLTKKLFQKKSRINTFLFTFKSIENKRNLLCSIGAICDHIVVLADWMKEILLLNGFQEDKIILINQGILPAKFYNPKTQIKTSSPIKLVYVGRIHPIKGIDLLVDGIMKFMNNEFTLTIFGPLNDDSFTKNIRLKTVNNKNIKWGGALEPEKVIETISTFDMFCLCSVVCEMAPLSILESFEAMVPVIASNNHGTKAMIVHDNNGLLFDSGNVEDFYSQLCRLIDNPELIDHLQKGISNPRKTKSVTQDHIKLYLS